MGRAAGVLVFQGSLVLAFRRFDREGFALPCGSIDEGETPAQAAVREAKEETGLDVELVPAQIPFVGFDTVGNNLVTTFLARVVGGKLIDEAPGEGMPLWASPYALTTGPYGHYNMRALRHFSHRAHRSDPVVPFFRFFDRVRRWLARRVRL
ncbi:MAG: hypothetical protein UY76_C0019G0009 [Candidatus Uhrbacteria bacterium GW2011_GWA2_52_8d]|uniref:Nudix hydrolase domain-containing protein n=1 Tax=Candidatus Uhrbacteria bacterium GW2011_GWA2_52_8d TaxID=1618979 RepID=A0A0G2AJE2_9BACT|nr:MAG: hypothetical protein UY76_C0019G0009 [Candidatus Uhrbacteria bacterium GW2011_GWA2_52_8d]